jgi:RHS repeat-associated protein
MTISQQHNKNINHSTFSYDGMQYAYDVLLLLFSAFYKELSKYSSNTNQYFFYSNHLISSNWITYTDGSVTQHMQNLPFGEPFIEQRATSYDIRYIPIAIGIKGKEMDSETGYQYFGARYYNSDISVWLSVDPLADKYPMISPYAYVFNNPMNMIDRWGLEGEDPERFGVGKRFVNWISGDGWKNKANNVILSDPSRHDVKDNGDNISYSGNVTSDGFDEKGYYSGKDQVDYKFGKGGVEVVSTDTRTGKSSTTNYTWKGFLNKNSRKDPIFKGPHSLSIDNIPSIIREFDSKFNGSTWSNKFRVSFEKKVVVAVKVASSTLFGGVVRVFNWGTTFGGIPSEREKDEKEKESKKE